MAIKCQCNRSIWTRLFCASNKTSANAINVCSLIDCIKYVLINWFDKLQTNQCQIQQLQHNRHNTHTHTLPVHHFNHFKSIFFGDDCHWVVQTVYKYLKVWIATINSIAFHKSKTSFKTNFASFTISRAECTNLPIEQILLRSFQVRKNIAIGLDKNVLANFVNRFLKINWN